MPDISQVANGDIIVFQSLATNDANNYRGQVVGFVKLDVAKGFGDVFANPSVAAPELLDFMLIKLLETPSVGFGRDKYIMPFSPAWISPATLEIIAVDKAAIIKVYEIDSANVKNLVAYMRAGGFKIRVESFI